jgi:hypothetical protein
MKSWIIIIVAFIAISGCKNDNDYSSIVGEWLVEDNGEQSEYRRYSVSIQRMPGDTASYKFSNFYKTGALTEMYVYTRGLDLVIDYQPVGDYHIQGSGTIQSDYEGISLEYEVTGSGMNETVLSEFSRK